MLTRLLVSGILESPPNDRRGLYAHHFRAGLVEMEDSEGDTLHGGELRDLMGKVRVTHGRRRSHEVDICDAAEIFGYLREIIARDGVAEKKHIGQLGVGDLRANFPGPLDFFGNRSMTLRAHERRHVEKQERENDEHQRYAAGCRDSREQRSSIIFTDVVHATLSSLLQFSTRAYTLLTASSTIATVNPAMPEPKSSLAGRPACFHSPVKTPAIVAVIIMKICNKPHPTDVPSAPR